ncbi:MAG: tetratricopeptide repeat protein [Pseudomonadota bacterium]
MANSDSFINEVTEEVRRDRLFGFLRKWAWAISLVIVLIVGAAAFFEVRRAQTEAAAQQFGDAVLAALDAEDPADRLAALAEIAPEGPGAEMLLALLLADQEAQTGEREAAANRLRAMAERSDLPQRYRDLAALKAHVLAPRSGADEIAMLDRMSQPGAPYRALAIELQAYLLISEGDAEGGVSLLEEILIDPTATPSLRQRASQAIFALESGAALTDAPLPEPEVTLPDAATLPTGTPDDAAPDEDAGDLLPPTIAGDGAETSDTGDAPAADTGEGGDLLPPPADGGTEDTGAAASD